MGQKTSPIVFRLGIIKDWESNWYSDKNYAALLLEDKKIRDIITAECARAGLTSIKIRRKTKNTEVTIKAARPGIIIGKSGTEADKLKSKIIKITKNKDIAIMVVEEKQVDLSAPNLAYNIAKQLEKRVAFRRAMKQAVTRSMRAGAQGIKILCAGRLGGAEIARTEWYREGKVPLHTIRADIDYSNYEALTIYGKIGIKVWVYKGDIMPQRGVKEEVV
ncbi:MAG: 30S ribosomal protein S3 [Candidatus Margulisbacteria bacterium GWF2_35_9]|nr:ribosomal protein S3 [uncultured bacterium]OGI07011.1 MAG: 30S ribosomal protein S3 [Candidatus Margulisbacteria bacterium GWF2_35_9]